MAATSQHRCVFVGNIPYDATEEQLIQICEEVGPVVSFRLVLDRETGKPKGYGFCEYKDEETALSARRNLQGYEINGRQLRVDFAENDKGADRNREQGRGGPGLASNADAQKPLSGGPAAHVDPVLHQPIGVQLAMTSASVMAAALGGSQMGSGQLNQNGSQGQSGLGNDPLSHYLAKMSRAQLHEILTHFKAMATENKELARQLLLANPLLPKALFQAEIMLGMVSPQVLQMPNLRQSSRLTTQPALNVDKRLIHPSHSGQGSQASLQNIPQTGLLPRVPKDQDVPPVNLTKDTFISQSSSSSLPLQHHLFVQPQLPQYPQQSQPEILSGNLSTSSIRPAQPFAGHSPQLPLPNSNFSHPILPRPSSSQLTFQPGLSNSSALLGVNTISREAGSSLQVGQDTILEARKDTLYTANHPSKLRRLEDGSKESAIITSNTSLTGPGQGIGTESVFSNQMGIVHGPPQPEKQVSQLAIPPEVESALLQQVMNLTAEQLSSLPPEQQQQVLQLQQMLR